MRRFGFGVFLAVVCVVSLVAQERACPEGQVWGGTKCVWKELCPNGRPAYYGPCEDSQAPDPVPPCKSDAPEEQPCKREKEDTGEKVTPPHDPTVVDQGCYGEVKFDGGKARAENRAKGIRRVLLVGGNAADLLDAYVAECSAKKLKMSLDHVTVFYFEGTSNEPKSLKGGADVKVTTTDFFNYRSIQTVWKNRLRQVAAAPRPNAEQDAVRLGSDLVCGAAKGDSR
jgi:hypothetical protein